MHEKLHYTQHTHIREGERERGASQARYNILTRERGREVGVSDEH